MLYILYYLSNMHPTSYMYVNLRTNRSRHICIIIYQRASTLCTVLCAVTHVPSWYSVSVTNFRKINKIKLLIQNVFENLIQYNLYITICTNCKKINFFGEQLESLEILVHCTLE